MDFYEVLRSTNPKTKPLLWSIKDKIKMNNTTEFLFQLQDLAPFFQGSKLMESGKLYSNIQIDTTSPKKLLLDISSWTEKYNAKLLMATIQA